MAARDLLSAILCLWPALSAAEAQEPTITVQGSCSVATQPDRARLEASAERRGPDAGRAIAEATSAYNRFRLDVEKLKLPDARLDSGGIQAGRLEDDDPARKGPTIYTASAGLAVETSSLEGLAQVMRLAAADGLGSIGPMEVFVSDALRAHLVSDCLPKAAADARQKAGSLLKGLDAGLGSVLRVEGVDAGGESLRPMAPGLMRMAKAQPTPELSAGPQTVTVTTTVTFGIATGKSR